MLLVEVPAIEFFDEQTGEFHQSKPIELRMEHSLVSMSKWEMRWRKPFLATKEISGEMLRDYFRCMTLSQHVDPIIYSALDKTTVDAIVNYINSDFSATTIRDTDGRKSSKIVTTEEIYWWMFSYGIPIDCQKWHFSRLLKLLRIASIYSQPQKKMSRREILNQNRSLNAARRAKMGSRG